MVSGVPISIELIKKLKEKLNVGNLRSIQLNCIPGKSSTRLDISDLYIIDEELPNKLVHKLLDHSGKFSFEISFSNLNLNLNSDSGDENRTKKLGLISKRLNNLTNYNKEDSQEYGYESFGFGFPVVVFSPQEAPNKVIKAPLFIWHLSIQKNINKTNTWTISRTIDHEIEFNNLLRAYIGQICNTKIHGFTDEELSDGILDFDELIDNSSKFIKNFSNSDLEELSNSLKIGYKKGVKKVPSKQVCEEQSTGIPRIYWGGVFGRFNQRNEAIRQELNEQLTEVVEVQNHSDDLSGFEYLMHSETSALTDPSQIGILNYLKENKHIVIQGPPGTGKSESITGIIINALEHGKKCLVVCEKKTAMEVLKTNLSNISSEIGDLVAVIEDVSRDRKQIVESVRDRYEMYGGNRFERPADTNLTETWELIEEHIEDINYRKKYFYEDEIVNDKKTKGWSSGVGKELLSKTRNKKNYIRSKIEKKISLEGPIDYNETSTNLRKIESEIKLLDYQNLLKKIPQSEILNNDPFKLQEQLSKLVPKSSKELKDFISVFENHLFDLEAKISDKIDSFINDIEASIKTLESKISNYSEKPSFKQDNIWYQVIKRIPFSSKGLKNDIEIFEYSNNTISQIVEKTSFVGVEISISANRTIESNLEDLKIVKSWINDFKLLSRDFKQKKYDLLIEEEFLGVKIKNEFKVQFLKWKKDLSECLDKYQTNKNNWHTTSNFLKALKWMLEFIVEISSAIDQGFINHFQWQSNFYKQPNFLQQFITLLLEEDAREWKGYFDEYYYHNQLVKNFNHKLSGGYDAQLEFLKTERERISNEIKSKIPKYWKFIQSEIPNVNIPQLYNKRGSRGNRRNSLRKIAKRSFDSLTAYFPVMMVSPNVCASMFELKPDLFDYVIFDEASQLKVEESITTLIRGERKVISGDSNQMPPSYWFTAIADSEEYEEEDLDPYQTWNENLLSNEGATDLANSESLLEFAELCGFKSFHLDFHYRSHHPLLIEFSNAAFYKGRLHPLPERIIHSPIQFITVNGLYENQQNRDEANVAIEILKNIQPGKNGELPSVGIATFNQKQKNLILELLKREFQLDQEFRERYLELEEKGLFVKNLENIQGDERDIIILCTTFGRDKEGIAQRKYGPIATTGLGHRLLNVIITRAKKKVFVLTSVPPEFYSGYKSELVGTNKVERGYFHAYLAYAKAVSEKDLKSVEAILTFLRGESKTNYTELGLTESPFEEAVYQYLIKEIDEERITLQYKTGGFRIDIAIKSKITGKEFLAIECDGATYHSSVEAYAWDSYRQEILEEHGFTFHRIWSRDFWENSDREIKKLVSFIKAQDELDQGTEALKDPVASHLFVKDLLEQTHFIEVEDEIKTEELSDDQDEEELNVSEENQVITDVEIRQKVVQVGDKITLLELDTGKELKVKFIKRNNNVNQSNGLIILSEKSPLGEVVIGRKVGETVELNNVEKYYRIIFIED